MPDFDTLFSNRRGHGGLRYCGIELSFKRYISVILILMGGIAVSSSPAVCDAVFHPSG